MRRMNFTNKTGLRPPTPKALPRVEPLGRVRLNFVKVYDKRLILKASGSNPDDNPELFIDLEHPRSESTQQNGPELHLGISANFRLESQRNSAVKPHIDFYIPASEIHAFLQAIIQANLRRSNRPQAPVGPKFVVSAQRPTSGIAVGSGQREKARSGLGAKSGFGDTPRSLLTASKQPAPIPRLEREGVR